MERFDDGTLAPARDSTTFVDYRHWLHHAQGSIMPLLVMRLIVGQLPKQAPRLMRPLMRGIEANIMQRFSGSRLELHLDAIEQGLQPAERTFRGRQLACGRHPDALPTGGRQRARKATVARLPVSCGGHRRAPPTCVRWNVTAPASFWAEGVPRRHLPCYK